MKQSFKRLKCIPCSNLKTQKEFRLQKALDREVWYRNSLPAARHTISFFGRGPARASGGQCACAVPELLSIAHAHI